MSSHDLIEHKKLNPCRLCGKCFDSEAELVTHEITVHPNVAGPRRHDKTQPTKNATARRTVPHY